MLTDVLQQFSRGALYWNYIFHQNTQTFLLQWKTKSSQLQASTLLLTNCIKYSSAWYTPLRCCPKNVQVMHDDLCDKFVHHCNIFLFENNCLCSGIVTTFHTYSMVPNKHCVFWHKSLFKQHLCGMFLKSLETVQSYPAFLLQTLTFSSHRYVCSPPILAFRQIFLHFSFHLSVYTNFYTLHREIPSPSPQQKWKHLLTRHSTWNCTPTLLLK